MSTPRSTLVAAFGALLLALAQAGCGGGKDDSADAAGPPQAAGIAKAVEVAYQDEGGLGEEEGALQIDLIQQGKALSEKASVKVKGTGKLAGTVEKGSAGKRFTLAAGVYTAEVEYTPSELAKGAGHVSNLVIKAGKVATARVTIDHPLGLLDVHFTNEGVPVDGKTHVTVYHAGEDPEVSVPLVSRQIVGQPVTLAKGLYDVHAEYQEGPAVKGEIWMKGLAVPGEMQKLTETRDFGLKITGVVVAATNFGQDASPHTQVYIYRPGANMSYAVAVGKGKAGELIPVEPGTYDLRVVFQPSDNPETWADKRMENIAVATTPENTKLSLAMEMEKPIATLQIKVLYGGKDVTDKSQVRIINSGADRGAASDVASAVGESRIVVPAGKYEMQVTYKDGAHHADGPWEPLQLDQGATVAREIKLGS